ncbi:alpha-mannosidase [Stackebrandtia soli]
MHDDGKLTEERWRRVLRERVVPAIHGPAEALTVEVWHAPGEPVPPSDGIGADFTETTVGERWGRPWGTSWFRFTGTVPADWSGRTVEAVVDLGFDGFGPGFSAEGLVYRTDGTPVKGLHPRNHWLRIDAAPGEAVEFYVEAASNPEIRGPVTELGDVETAGDEPLYRLRRAELAVFRPEVFELAHDLEVAGQLAVELPVELPRRAELWRAIGRALDALDLADVPGSAAAARAVLEPALAAGSGASAHTLWAVGHAHIDSAWLWPLRETVRKVARTASNVVNLMDDHPDFVFAMSQAQQLAWIAEHRPEVYERVKEKIEGGQFVPVGGMWVESDTNMPGSEALARQFVHGKRFFLDEFGIETEEVWLPDSFGYSAALPQLVKLSGSRWFLTQKISWSQTNPFPHHTFWWEGLDGTRVFTHFPPVDTYNAELSGKQVAHAVANFRDKGGASMSLVPFGHGDGGGGPTAICSPARGDWRTSTVPRRFGSRGRRSSSPPPRPNIRTRRCGSASCTWSCTGAPTRRRRRRNRATAAASTCCARRSCGRPRRP